MSRCIVSVGVSQSRLLEPYVARFKESFTPENSCADEVLVWNTEWPPGSLSHHECNYGFKAYAMVEARRRGHTSILWLDIACYVEKPIEPLWQRIERDGHVLVRDDNALGKWSSDRSLVQFGMSRDQAMEIKLLCGTCYGFDLRVERSRAFLDRFLALATPVFFNGTYVSRLPGLASHPRPGSGGAQVSNDERVWGHRADEAISSLLAHELGMGTVSVDEEFAGGNGVNERTCIRSGYDIVST